MAGLIKYFKHTQEKDKLDTGTLPDGPLSRDDIPSSSINIGITNTRVCQVQQKASSERRSRGSYISPTPAQKFFMALSW